MSERDTTLPVPAVELDDAGLVARAKRGETDALEALARRHLAEVFEVAARVLGDRELAQDAVQDTFVNAFGAIGSFRSESSFRTWLLRIAVNASRTLLRRGARRREVPADPAELLPSDDPGPAAVAEIRSESGRVEAALQRLPLKQRLAVTLRVYQGLSYREIGEAADCSEGAARVNYHLGIKRLREELLP